MPERQGSFAGAGKPGAGWVGAEPEHQAAKLQGDNCEQWVAVGPDLAPRTGRAGALASLNHPLPKFVTGDSSIWRFLGKKTTGQADQLDTAEYLAFRLSVMNNNVLV